MSKWIKIVLTVIGAVVIIQVGTYLLFATRSIPSIALRLTPEYTHFAKGTTFSWVWLKPCESLTETHKTRLHYLLDKRYDTIYQDQSDIPESRIIRDADGKWVAYDDGFTFDFNVLSRGPFLVRVTHADLEANLAASWAEHTYIWILFGWVKVHQGPMLVS